jgi:rubrerythrin
MNTFEEIIQFAIKHEEAEAGFYENMANRTDNKDAKQALRAHANEEREHKRHLENILQNNRLSDGAKRYPDPDMKLSDYLVTKVTEDSVGSFEDALLLAAKREKKAELLYRNLAKHATDDELRKVLLFLADQERCHGDRLEQQFDDSLTDN